MQNASTFEEFYEKELKGLLIPLEKERKVVLHKEFLGYSLLGVSVLLFLITISSQIPPLGFIAFFSFLAGIIFLGVIYGRRKKYFSAFKENIVRRVINYIDPSMQYNPEIFVSRKDYDRSGLFLQKPDSYKGDDYIEGFRDKTFFRFSELHTTRQVSTGKSSHTVTIFRGLFFIADFNKHFQGSTYVWSESNPQLNFLTKIFSSFASDLEKVKLESVDFENRFIVYSNDQVEARYILTPSFMERIVKLEQLMGAGISFSFVNTNIYVAVPINDKLFEPSFYRPNDYQSISDYFNTVHIVFDIIDELKLNERLWTKE